MALPPLLTYSAAPRAATTTPISHSGLAPLATISRFCRGWGGPGFHFPAGSAARGAELHFPAGSGRRAPPCLVWDVSVEVGAGD